MSGVGGSQPWYPHSWVDQIRLEDLSFTHRTEETSTERVRLKIWCWWLLPITDVLRMVKVSLFGKEEFLSTPARTRPQGSLPSWFTYGELGSGSVDTAIPGRPVGWEILHLSLCPPNQIQTHPVSVHSSISSTTRFIYSSSVFPGPCVLWGRFSRPSPCATTSSSPFTPPRKPLGRFLHKTLGEGDCVDDFPGDSVVSSFPPFPGGPRHGLYTISTAS